MSTFTIEHRAALAGRPPLSAPGLSVKAMPEGHVIQALACNMSSAAPEALTAAFDPDRSAIRPAAPGQWFIIGDGPMAAGDCKAIAARLTPEISLVDQSHGRVRISVSGDQARRLLAKGTAVDLSPESFGIGSATTTLVGHISVHLSRNAADEFELLVMRGFAVSLWDELQTMAGEFC